MLTFWNYSRVTNTSLVKNFSQRPNIKSLLADFFFTDKVLFYLEGRIPLSIAKDIHIRGRSLKPTDLFTKVSHRLIVSWCMYMRWDKDAQWSICISLWIDEKTKDLSLVPVVPTFWWTHPEIVVTLFSPWLDNNENIISNNFVNFW